MATDSTIRLQEVATPDNPPTDNHRIFVGTDGHLKKVDETGAVFDYNNATSYSDEQAQDAVGSILQNTDTVSLTYADGVPEITADVNDNSLTAAKLQTDSVTTPKIQDAAVTQDKLADNSVGTGELINASVDNTKLADNSVSQAKMQDNSVGTAEIIDSNVTTAKINNLAVDSTKLADDAVTNAKILDAAVGNTKLADNSISPAKLQTDSVTTIKIIDNGISEAKLQDNSVTTNKIANDAVTTAKILDGAVAESKLADTSVTPGTYGSASQSATIVVGQKGRLTSAVDTPINHDVLQNFVANKHIDHSTVNIDTAVTSGLNGGGDITATRNLVQNDNRLTVGDRLAVDDEIAFYDTSAAGQRKLSLYQFMSRRGRIADQAYFWSSDFVISESSVLNQAGAGAANSTQQGTFGMDNIEKALGITETDTGTTAAGRRTVSSDLGSLTTGLGRLRFGARHALNQLSNGTDTFTSYLGFINVSGAGDQNAAAYFRYTHGVNGGRWEAVTANGTGSPSRTAVDTGVAADTLYSIFEVEIAEDTSSARFYINDVLVATISTTLPPTSSALNTSFGFGWKIEKSVGTASVAHSTDWAYFELGRSTAR